MISFDRQASDFDLRAGLPVAAARQVAAALAGMTPGENGAILDLGAGTGQIGEHLVREHLGRSRYLGLDVSAPMLAVFRRKLGRLPGEGCALVQADAGAPWPIASGGVELIFLSRAAHLLPPDLLVKETLRVASPEGALVVFGGVRSRRESLRAILRREMRRLLAEHGTEGRNAAAAQRSLANAFAEHGGEALPVISAAIWPVVERARDALAAWRAKEGLGGKAVSPETQDSVLRRLEDWIRQSYGSLDVERETTERYELAAIRLPTLPKENPGATK